MSLCQKCYGCNKLEDKRFKELTECKDFRNANICKGCNCEMFKYPDKFICPNCDKEEWLKRAKGYMQKLNRINFKQFYKASDEIILLAFFVPLKRICGGINDEKIWSLLFK